MGKKGGGGARRAMKSASKTVSRGAKSAGRSAAHHTVSATRKIGSSAGRTTRSIGRATRPVAKHTSKAIGSGSRFARQTGFHSSAKRGFSTFGKGSSSAFRSMRAKSRDTRLRWGASQYYRVITPLTIRKSRYNNDSYMHSSRCGYFRYDSLNSYQHRRYARMHNYHYPTNHFASEEVEVTYDSLRATLPPDSPNFCFIALSDLSDSGKCEVDVSTKVMSLILRNPPGEHIGAYGDIGYVSVRLNELLQSVGAMLREDLGRDPAEAGFWVPNWVFPYSCCAGDLESRQERWRKENFDDAVNEAVCMFNRHNLISCCGIAATYVDIGNSFSGIALEVLPYLSPSEKNMEVAILTDPWDLERVPNPQYLQTAGLIEALSNNEVNAILATAYAARGHELDEEMFDDYMSKAALDYQKVPEGAEVTDAYEPFTVTVPPGVGEGYVLTVQAPNQGVLISVVVPSGCGPGMEILVTPPSMEKADVSASMASHGPSASGSAIYGVDIRSSAPGSSLPPITEYALPVTEMVSENVEGVAYPIPAMQHLNLSQGDVDDSIV